MNCASVKNRSDVPFGWCTVASQAAQFSANVTNTEAVDCSAITLKMKPESQN